MAAQPRPHPAELRRVQAEKLDERQADVGSVVQQLRNVTSSTRLNSSGDVSMTSARTAVIAELTQMSIAPSSASMRCAAFPTTSPGMRRGGSDRRRGRRRSGAGSELIEPVERE